MQQRLQHTSRSRRQKLLTSLPSRDSRDHTTSLLQHQQFAQTVSSCSSSSISSSSSSSSPSSSTLALLLGLCAVIKKVHTAVCWADGVAVVHVDHGTVWDPSKQASKRFRPCEQASKQASVFVRVCTTHVSTDGNISTVQQTPEQRQIGAPPVSSFGQQCCERVIDSLDAATPPHDQPRQITNDTTPRTYLVNSSNDFCTFQSLWAEA